MKKITSILFLCMTAAMAFAGPVSRTQALDIARNYLQKQRVARGVSAQVPDLSLAYECVPKSTRGVNAGTPLYYVFNQGEQDGFLVVAGDDRMTPVLGVVDDGHFAMSQVHESLRWWLDALEETMVSVTKSDDTQPVFVTKADDGLKPFVEPMVKVNWGQGAPHNDRCPMDEEHKGRSLVGCTAVAMAQVLSKWQYPEKGSGLVNYTTYSHKMHLSENLDKFVFDWDKMLPSYAGNKGTAEEKAAVAELMYACGLSVEMNYCSQASGAFVYADHMEKHLRIDPACTNVERIYYTRAEWDALVKRELSEGRPVIYNGFSMSAGHAFVCDGYNRDGLFHINWGWDGSLNGYFALAELNSAVEHAGAPTDAEGSFNLDQSMVYGIQPKVGSGNRVKYTLCYTSVKPNGNPSKSKVGVTISTLRSDGNGFKGALSLGIFDKENNYIDHVNGVRNQPMTFGQTFNTYTLSGGLPDGLADGVYTLRPVFKGAMSTKYEPMRGRKGSSYVDHLVMTVKGEQVTLKNPEMIDAKLQIVSVKPIGEKCYAGAMNALEITLRNDGAMYNGPVVISRNEGDKSNKVYDNNYIIESGEECVLRVKIAAPEGVAEDELDLWIAKTDNDLNYNNGFEYGLVGSFKYDLTIPSSGKPQLSVKKFSILNKNAYIGDTLDVDVTLSNAGGFYGNNIFCFVFPQGGGSSLTSGKKQVYIDKGETVSFNVQVPVGSLSAGSYFMHVYYLDKTGALQTVNDTRYSFTIKDSGSISISNNEGFGVYFASHAFYVPKNVECGVVTNVDANRLSIDYRYMEGDVVPANTPVIVKAQRRATYNYKAAISSESAPTDNLLKTQVDEDGYTYAGVGDYWYYNFDDDGNRENYGFYLKYEDGAKFKLKLRQCYLAVPAGQGNAAGYPFNAAVTGIEDIHLGAGVSNEAVIYTLSGVRVSSNFNELPKGIYIVNGKKMMK